MPDLGSDAGLRLGVRLSEQQVAEPKAYNRSMRGHGNPLVLMTVSLMGVGHFVDAMTLAASGETGTSPRHADPDRALS